MFCLQKMISNGFFYALQEAWNSCPVNFADNIQLLVILIGQNQNISNYRNWDF